MAKFRATLRVSDLNGADPAAVQRALDERLKQAGIERWKVLSIENEAAAAARRQARRPVRNHLMPRRPVAVRQPHGDAGGFLLAAAVVWAALLVYFYVM